MLKRISNFSLAVYLLVGCTSLVAPVLQVGDLEGMLSVDRQEGRVGEPVHITFAVKNSSQIIMGKPETAESKTKSVMDIVVSYGGAEYARWSRQQASDTDLFRLELEPGESRTISLTWVPDEQARNKPVYIQGILRWREDRTTDTGVLFWVR